MMSYPTFIILTHTDGQVYSSLVLYDPMSHVFSTIPSLKSFEHVADLFQLKEIAGVRVDQILKDSYGNTVAAFLEKNGVQGHLVVQYDPNENKINPPVSYRPFIPSSPTIICLKGQIRKYGPSLENAPANVVYIGRNLNMGGWKLPKSKWGNPFPVKDIGRDEALRKYREYVLSTPELLNALPELGGKVLACWCHPDPCHGNILTELYNQFVK